MTQGQEDYITRSASSGSIQRSMASVWTSHALHEPEISTAPDDFDLALYDFEENLDFDLDASYFQNKLEAKTTAFSGDEELFGCAQNSLERCVRPSISRQGEILKGGVYSNYGFEHRRSPFAKSIDRQGNFVKPTSPIDLDSEECRTRDRRLSECELWLCSARLF
mmetsp:Transcript_18077/g.41016  ORF Transcript_18077/g.41016 Transcript_18077/m.41016 type:complete len:165 (-) Transcript_18077:26-520(-)|eukprot:753923-Hanusia_phi.AAC.3